MCFSAASSCSPNAFRARILAESAGTRRGAALLDPPPPRPPPPPRRRRRPLADRREKRRRPWHPSLLHECRGRATAAHCCCCSAAVPAACLPAARSYCGGSRGECGEGGETAREYKQSVSRRSLTLSSLTLSRDDGGTHTHDIGCNIRHDDGLARASAARALRGCVWPVRCCCRRRLRQVKMATVCRRRWCCCSSSLSRSHAFLPRGWKPIDVAIK